LAADTADTSVGEQEVRMVTKQAMVDAITQLPDDATVEDAMDRLFILEGLEQGIAQVESGRFVTNEEAKRRMATWPK
jgi:predicted transcriptional regulator